MCAADGDYGALMLPQVLVLDSELRDHGGCRGELALEFSDVGAELVDRGALVGDRDC